MKRTVLFILVGWMISVTQAPGQEIYRWVDEKGTIHFADDLSLVPEKHRSRVEKKTQPAEPPGHSSPAPSSPSPPSASEPKAVRKDRFGRGESWWRAKGKEWEEKLQKAQSGYEKAYQAQKAKEKELEDAKFKPESWKRRLRAELKALEEKTKSLEMEVMEARNMLERVLPRQAEEDRADPKWLKSGKSQEPGPPSSSSSEPPPPGAPSPPETPAQD